MNSNRIPQTSVFIIHITLRPSESNYGVTTFVHYDTEHITTILTATGKNVKFCGCLTTACIFYISLSVTENLQRNKVRLLFAFKVFIYFSE